jgi:CRISPR-associated protein Cas5d
MNNWCLEVWGDFACFTRPEMKVERVSYDIITPSAARAIYESILWKPAIKWHITKIEILKPIKWISVRRNEVSKKVNNPSAKQMAGEPMGFYIEDARQQRAGLFLRDVCYRIHAYFEFIPIIERKSNRSVSEEFWADQLEQTEFKAIDDAPAKYAAMFERRAKKGQCFHRPYLGCREFACDFKLIQKDTELHKPIDETRDLGFMLYDLNFNDLNDIQANFFRAKMENGIVNTDRREIEVLG